MDPHEVLGVSPDASEDELRAAYRDLVRRHHPDRHVGESDTYRANQAARMAEVTGAWTLLHDPDALARYRANRARVGRPPTATSTSGSGTTRPDADTLDHRRPAREFGDDDQFGERWARTPTPPAERVAATKAAARGSDRTARRRAASGGPSRGARLLNAVGWLILLGLVAGVLLLGTDRGREVLDDLRTSSPATSSSTSSSTFPSTSSLAVAAPTPRTVPLP